MAGLLTREAMGQDLPALVGLVKALHTSANMALPVEESVTRHNLQSMILRPSGLVLVSGDVPNAFIAATVGYSTVSSLPVAQEHGWYAAPEAKGAGLRLLIMFERWAKEQGCGFIRMSTPPGNERAASLLKRRGFFLSECVWAKAI